jgi:ribosomal protein L37AE/L43A
MARNQVQSQKGISLPKFLKHYGQEKQCQIAMDKLRWPDGFKCPECGHPGHCKISRGLYQCNRCRRQTSLTSGTVLNIRNYRSQPGFLACTYPHKTNVVYQY